MCLMRRMSIRRKKFLTDSSLFVDPVNIVNFFFLGLFLELYSLSNELILTNHATELMSRTLWPYTVVELLRGYAKYNGPFALAVKFSS